MRELEGIFKSLPNHLILSDRIYKLSISAASNSGRAFNRGLIDLGVEGVNPLSTQDNWRTLLGVSEELFEDYPGFRISVPLEWLLFRFLCHHVRTNSVHIISGPGGDVLKTTTFKSFLGKAFNDDQADEILKSVLSSWVRAVPEEAVELSDLYVSTDLYLDTLKRSINSLIFQNHIEAFADNTYKIKPSILGAIQSMKRQISFDRRSNRYYQEILIQAEEPFCFVIMPFREEQFPQAIYFNVIKPLVEKEFKVSCYRVDEDFRPDRIDNKIYTYMLRASFIIAEVTTRNPNVMYELGLAHMLEKDCVILTQKPHSEVPFDINRISAQQYENEDQLRSYLRQSISALAFKVN
jgi:hypothetical protein